MAATVTITSQPTAVGRRARVATRLLLAVAVIVLHVVVAAVVPPLRILRVVVNAAATHAAYAELYLASKTGHRPLGQTAGFAVADAFATEFRTSYKTATTTT